MPHQETWHPFDVAYQILVRHIRKFCTPHQWIRRIRFRESVCVCVRACVCVCGVCHNARGRAIRRSEGLDARGRVHGVNKTRQIGLNHDYDIFTPFCVLLQLFHHVGPLNDGNCRIIRHAVLMTRYHIPLISAGLNAVKTNFTTRRHIYNIYNDSAKLIKSCDVASDTSDCGNLP